MKLQLKEVVPSTVAAIGFDSRACDDASDPDRKGTMWVRFTPNVPPTEANPNPVGTTYAYDDVPYTLYVRFLGETESIGKLVRTELREKFRTWKLVFEPTTTPSESEGS